MDEGVPEGIFEGVPESEPKGISIEGVNLILLILVALVFIKLFVLVECPCGCGAMSQLWCCDAAQGSEGMDEYADIAATTKSMENVPAMADPSDKPTIYYHYTEWCGYCKRLKPVWNSVKGRMSHRAFFIENDEDKQQTPNVNSYPTIIAHVNGQQIKYDGGKTEDELMKFVQDAIDMKTANRK